MAAEVGFLRLLPGGSNDAARFLERFDDAGLADAAGVVFGGRSEPACHIGAQGFFERIGMEEAFDFGIIRLELDGVDGLRQTVGEEVEKAVPVLLKAPVPEGLGIARQPVALPRACAVERLRGDGTAQQVMLFSGS
jgi:hypothetical protein